MNLMAAIKNNVEQALKEDIGSGDLTAALIPEGTKLVANVICRESAILCGTQWFDASFQQCASDTHIHWLIKDGAKMGADQKVCTVSGDARTLLSAERTALNFLQTLSAVATLTHNYVDAISGTNAIIVDTRKTLPGLRAAQKYAVKCGGGSNHRLGLYDGVLIKENHIAATGGIAQVLKAARSKTPAELFIQIEVETLDELTLALTNGADKILLDNFSLSQLHEAVILTKQLADNPVILEASGNITLDNVRAVAETGVNRISIGSLTKNIKAVDLSMQFINGRL
jgi:nicotinate-nucleotide pyrophosphorylase (carboxylating)